MSVDACDSAYLEVYGLIWRLTVVSYRVLMENVFHDNSDFGSVFYGIVVAIVNFWH